MRYILVLMALCACVISCHTQPVQVDEEVSCVYCSSNTQSSESDLASPWIQ